MDRTQMLLIYSNVSNFTQHVMKVGQNLMKAAGITT